MSTRIRKASPHPGIPETRRGSEVAPAPAVNAPSRDWTLLHMAAEEAIEGRRIRLIESLLSTQKIDILTPNDDGVSLLELAARAGIEVFKPFYEDLREHFGPSSTNLQISKIRVPKAAAPKKVDRTYEASPGLRTLEKTAVWTPSHDKVLAELR